MVQLVVGAFCVIFCLVFLLKLANHGRIRYGRPRVLIFVNGELLQENISYVLDDKGVPTFRIPVGPRDVVQRVRLHGTFVALGPQDYRVGADVRPEVPPFVRITPPNVSGEAGAEMVRRLQEALQAPHEPLDVSMSCRAVARPSEGNQEPAPPRFDRDLDV